MPSPNTPRRPKASFARTRAKRLYPRNPLMDAVVKAIATSEEFSFEGACRAVDEATRQASLKPV